MDNELLGIVLKAGGMLATSVGKMTVMSVFRHVILNQPQHVIERFFSTLSSAEEYNNEKLKNDTLRTDWYSDNDNNLKFVENMVRQIISDTQGKKSEYIAKFYVNIRFSSNDDIDEQAAFSYMEIMDTLSWRQLCIISLILLQKKGRLGRYDSITEEKVENLPGDQRMTFHTISREYKELMDKGYVSGTSMGVLRGEDKWNYEPWLDTPALWDVPYHIERLYDLMNLHEISETEIIQTFSIWDIALK